jgi:hypothetical protein
MSELLAPREVAFIYSKCRFDDECSKLIYRRKQAKLQWLHNPNQVNGDNMDNVRLEASRTFRTKKKGISEKQN